MQINVVALGEKENDISLSGYQKIQKVKKIYIRSEKLVGAKQIKKEKEIISFDDLYENVENFDDLYKKIADILMEEKEEICYLTEGSGVGDKVIKFLPKDRVVFYPAAEKGIRNILDCGENYTVISAYDFLKIENIGGILADLIYIKDIDSKILASDLKLSLSKIVGDEEEILFCTKKRSEKIPLYSLDSMTGYDVNCGVLVFNKDFLSKQKFTFTDLLNIVTRLRAPNGCPWDRAQTHQSIRKNTIEEAYEVAEAIDLNDADKLIEETGDLMLQTVLHAEIAKDSGEYDISFVTTGICDKLIKRHTHVFGNDKVTSEENALKLWESNKEKLKNQTTATKAIEDIPKTLPSLTYAEKVAKKAAKANFDFRNVDDIINKIQEELDELKESVKENTDIAEELGDLLFATCNLSRFLSIDSEEALHFSSKKFISRFELMEKLVNNDKMELKKMSDEKLEEYYQKAKKQLKEKR